MQKENRQKSQKRIKNWVPIKPSYSTHPFQRLRPYVEWLGVYTEAHLVGYQVRVWAHTL